MRRFGSALLALFLAVPAVAAVTTARAATPTTSALEGRTVLVAPTRILDTCTGNGAPAKAIGAHQSLALQVAGRAGLPQGGLSAAYLTLTETGATAGGFLSVGPESFDRPVASALNFTGPGSVADSVIETLPSDGRIVIYNGSAGAVQVIVDVTGYVIGSPVQSERASTKAVVAGGLAPALPWRLTSFDGQALHILGPGEGEGLFDPPNLSVAGMTTITVTVTHPVRGGYLSLSPPTDAHSTSILNFAAGQTIANTLVLSTNDPDFRVYNRSAGAIGLIIDVGSVISQTGAAAPSTVFPVTPSRILDTRVATGAPRGPVAAHRTISVDAGPSVPATASGLLVNLTQTGSTGSGFLSAWADGTARPIASVADFAARTTTANFAVIPLGADHRFNVYNGSSGTVSLVADVFGYVSAPGTPAAAITDLVVTPTAHDANVTWANVRWTKSADTARTVVVRRPGTSAPTSVFDGSVVADTTGTSAIDDGTLLKGMTYTYRAFAVSADGGLAAAAPIVSQRIPGATDPLSTGVAYLASTPDPGFQNQRSAGIDNSNGSMTAEVLTTSEISLKATQPSSSAGSGIDLLAPVGQHFHIGYYPIATPPGSRVPGLPSAEFTAGPDQYLNSGFEIRDLAADSAGNLTRLDLLFTESPTPQEAPFYTGEFRFGYSDDTFGYTVSARTADFGLTPLGAASVRLPVWIDNNGTVPITVAPASVSSPDFTIANDSCAGRTLQPRWTCAVTVSQGAPAPGPHSAVLTIPVAGHAESVELDAVVPTGHTELDLSGGGFVGGGSAHALPDASDPMSVVSSGTQSVFTTSDGTNSYFVEVSVPTGQRLTPGVHATGEFAATDTWGLYVYGAGRGCSFTHGSVDVKSVTLDALGLPEHADFTFTQYCDDTPDPLTGHVQWRNESDVAPPAAVTRLAITGSGASRVVSWQTPADRDYACTVVRLYKSTAAGPADHGVAVYSGTGRSTALTGLVPGVTYTLVAYPVDTSGNVGAGNTVSVTG